MRNKLLLAVSLLVFSSCQTRIEAPKADPMTLSFGSKKVPFEILSTLVPERELTYKDSYDGRDLTVVGFPLHLALNSFMGEVWKDMDGILFTSSDGYKVEIPVAKILRYKPLLAYKYSEKISFQDLAPYALIWDSIQFPELYKSNNKHWPFQIVRMDATRFMSQQVNLSTNPASKIISSRNVQ